MTTHRHALRIALAVSLAATSLLLVPAVAGQFGAGTGFPAASDGFEDYSLFLQGAPSPTSSWPSEWTYDTVTAGGAALNWFVDNTRAATGTKSLYHEALGTASDARLRVDFGTTTALCDGSEYLRYSINAEDLPSGSASLGMQVYTSTGAYWVVAVTSTGAFQANLGTLQAPSTVIHSPIFTAQDFVFQPDTWYDVSLGPFNCPAQSFQATIIPHGGPASAMRGVNVDVAQGGAAQAPAGMAVTGGSNAPDSDVRKFWLDDIQWVSNIASELPTEFSDSPSFCSARGNDHFGYNYDEDVTRKVDPGVPFPSNSISGAYTFKGDADNYAYLAKALQPTKGAKTFFRIEAHTESTSSVFRVAYSFVDPTAWFLPEPGVPDAERLYLLATDAKGNGKDTASFSSQIEVRFLETDNDWNVQFYYVTGGGGRTKLGGAWLGDNPNQPTAYALAVDTRPGHSYIELTHADGTVIGSGLGQMRKSLPAAFQDLNIRQQWFVGYAVDNFGNRDALTFLDDKSVSASTCIYTHQVVGGQDGGVAVMGDPGAGGPKLNSTTKVPEGLLPDAPEGEPDGGAASVVDGLFAGVGSETRKLFAFGSILLFVLAGRRKFDLEADTIKVGVLVLWIANIWLGNLSEKSLIAAGIIGVMMFSKKIANVWS